MAPIYGGYGGTPDVVDIGGYQQADIADHTSTPNLPTEWYTTKTPMSGIPVGTVFTGDEASRVAAYETGQQISQLGGSDGPSFEETLAETYVEFIDDTVSNIGNVTQEAAAGAVGATNEVIQTVGQTTEGIIRSTAAPIDAAAQPLGAALQGLAPVALVLGLAFVATR